MQLLAIEEARKLIEERTEKLAGMGQYDNQRYNLEAAVNELCAVILLVSIALAEPETGVEYYFKYSIRHDKAITLYCALDLWIKVYEYGVKKKIKPHDFLQTRYEEMKGQISEQGIKLRY